MRPGHNKPPPPTLFHEPRQWWTLWFALFLMGGALALTLVPVKHLLAWRAVMAHFFTMLALLCMTAANYALPLFVW